MSEDWADINNAPRDGTSVLAAYKGKKYFDVVYWDKYFGNWTVDGGNTVNPTHYQAIKEAPK